MNRFFFLSIILVIQIQVCEAQDCFKLFKDSYDKLRSTDGMTDQSGMLLKYGVVTVSAGDVTTSDNFIVKSVGSKVSLSSTDLDIFQDEKTMVVIQKITNVVFLTTPLPQTKKQSQFKGIGGLQDSLVNKMILKSCVTQPLPQCKACKKITFKLPQELAASRVKEIFYWINETKREIVKVKIDFYPEQGAAIKSMEYTIDLFDRNYSGETFAGKAIDRVLNDNKLKPPYTDFELIDQRK